MRARMTIVAALGAIFGAALYLSSRTATSPLNPAAPTPPATPLAGSSPAVPQSHPQGSSGSPEIQRLLEERLGSGFKAELNREGFLSAVRGAREGSKPAAAFKPEDPQAAIERAREILKALESALGLQPHSPLEDPVARNNAHSAQVFFQQKIEGRPLAPYGSVTVDLGPNGELLGLDSAYVRDVRTASAGGLTVEQARVRARSAAAGQIGAGSRVDGGHAVYWLSSPGGPSRIARPAYEFDAGGVQVVVDAEDGRILAKRDQRQR